MFKGELPEKEKILKDMSDYVAGDQEKGIALWKFVMYGRQGKTCEEVKEFMSKER